MSVSSLLFSSLSSLFFSLFPPNIEVVTFAFIGPHTQHTVCLSSLFSLLVSLPTYNEEAAFAFIGTHDHIQRLPLRRAIHIPQVDVPERSAGETCKLKGFRSFSFVFVVKKMSSFGEKHYMLVPPIIEMV